MPSRRWRSRRPCAAGMRHRVGRARLERRDRAKHLVGPRGCSRTPATCGRERRPRRAGRRPAVEADRDARACRRDTPASGRWVSSSGGRSARPAARPRARALRCAHAALGGAWPGRGPSRAGCSAAGAPRRGRDEHRRGAGERHGAHRGDGQRTAPAMPLPIHQSLTFTARPRMDRLMLVAARRNHDRRVAPSAARHATTLPA